MIDKVVTKDRSVSIQWRSVFFLLAFVAYFTPVKSTTLHPNAESTKSVTRTTEAGLGSFDISIRGGGGVIIPMSSSLPYLWSTLIPSPSKAKASSSFSSKKSRPSRADYTKSLEDQIAFMDQQLRQTHSELALLKDQWEKRKQAVKETARQGLPKKQSSRQKQQLKSLQLELSSVQSQVQVLEKLKSSLEARLEEQQLLAEKLEQRIREGKIDDKLKQRLENDFERRVQELHHQHELETQRQLERYEDLLEKQMAAASEQAHQEVMATLDEKIEAARQVVLRESEQELNLERKKAAAAVEKQRSKMRALARAMAIRETKLYNLEKKKKQKKKQKAEEGKRTAQKQLEEKARLFKLEKERLETEERERQRQIQLEEERIEAEKEKQRQIQLEEDKAKQLKLEMDQKEELARQVKLEHERQSEAMKLAHEQAVARNLERKRKISGASRWRPPGFGMSTGSESLDVKDKDKKKNGRSPPPVTVHKVECWQRHVPWQPVQLPPRSVVKLSFDQQ